jgi:hypothetical protein
MDTEFPWQNYSDWKALWNSDRSEKQFAMSLEEREALVLMPDELTIYRGSKRHDVDVLSWILSRETAIKFARRFGGDHLMTAVAKKHDVHAFLTRREEQEVVVDKFLIKHHEVLPPGLIAERTRRTR